MRLLNVHTLQFREFYGTPDKYVVTSHRWSAGNEATIKDIRNGRRTDRSGYKKVEGFAKFVREHIHHVDWLWIDTCCVNQDSDREVSEAVNSMFRWYSQAELCLAYLADVGGPRDWNAFRQSDWFCRGWTLQELLAPPTVIFLSQDWAVIGRKGNRQNSCKLQVEDTWPLDSAVAGITGIPQLILTDYGVSKSYSIGERLAWMTGRNTTREEDMVYSLFGIFDVALPVIYGEGHARAKRRLMKEIAETSELEAVHDAGDGDRLAIRTTRRIMKETAEASELEALYDAGDVGTLAKAPSKTSTGKPSNTGAEDQLDKLISVSQSTTLSRGLKNQNTSNVLLPEKRIVHVNDAGDISDDSIASVDEDLAAAALSEGDDAFRQGYYNLAELHLREAIQHVIQMPEEKRDRYALAAMELRVAICAFHLREPSSAETALIDVIKGQELTPVDLALAQHVLTQIYVQQGKFNLALVSCRRAYSARKKALGKHNELCYESLALLSMISKLLDHAHDARRFLSLIPNDLQTKYCRPFRNLAPGWHGHMTYRDVAGTASRITFSPNSKLVAFACDDDHVSVLDVKKGEKVMQFNVNTNVLQLMFSADCGQIASVSLGQAVKRWHVKTGEELWSHTYAENSFTKVMFTSPNKLLVFNNDKSLRSATSGEELVSFEHVIKGYKFTPNGAQIVFLSKPSILCVWDVETRRVARQLDICKLTGELSPSSVKHCVFSSDGSELAIAFNGGTFVLWNLSAGSVSPKFSMDASDLIDLTKSSNRMLAIVRRDNELRLWEVASGPAAKPSRFIVPWNSSIAFSPNGLLLAVGTRDRGNITIWEVSALLEQFPEGNESGVNQL